jgi:hypothetical protein
MPDSVTSSAIRIQRICTTKLSDICLVGTLVRCFIPLPSQSVWPVDGLATSSMTTVMSRSLLHLLGACHLLIICRYTDLLGEYSAGLYGHSEPVLIEAMQATLQENGSNLGANTKHEVRFASLICERFSLDTVRFTNSGTEANLHALMAARHFTGRDKVVVFTGGYHGSVLGFSTKPVSNTVDQQNFVVAEYNNISAAQAAIEETADVGTILIEGMQGASGNIVGTDEFLLAVQASARKVSPHPKVSNPPTQLIWIPRSMPSSFSTRS